MKKERKKENVSLEKRKKNVERYKNYKKENTKKSHWKEGIFLKLKIRIKLHKKQIRHQTPARLVDKSNEVAVLERFRKKQNNRTSDHHIKVHKLNAWNY